MLGALLLTALLPDPAWCQEVYYSAPLEHYRLEQVETPASEPAVAPVPFDGFELMAPRVVLESAGEAYLAPPDGGYFFNRDRLLSDTDLAIRAPEGEEIRGRLFLPREDRRGHEIFRFSVPAALLGDDSPRGFYEGKAAHYSRLAAADLPGAAWFRHQADAAWKEADRHPAGLSRAVDRWRQRSRFQSGMSEAEDAYELFSGGRAVAENLRLDRVLEISEKADRTIPIGTLPGIDIEELDWTERLEGTDPELDPLAAWIPADQHGLFFPSLESLEAVLDEAARSGTPVLRMVEPRSEDARTRSFYERQLGIEVAGLGELLGPQEVTSLALTGSDPFLRTGTDLALLFQCRDAGQVLQRLRKNQAEAFEDSGTGAWPEHGELGGLTFQGYRSPDRLASGFTARHQDVVILTNSAAQLRRLAAVIGEPETALATTPEYRFFRTRYPRANRAESAFLLLSDATIRRWGSPKWRIGAARRTLAASLLADRQARRIQDQTSELVSSEEYGTLAFLTPIAELQIDLVSQQEANAYDQFRNRYQHAWRAFFDPIAAVLELSPERTALDLSVLPLTESTDYGEMIELTRGVSLKPASGDPHADTLLHWVMALNPRSDPILGLESELSTMTPGLSVNPLAWVGEAVAVYADQDPFWQEWATAEDPDEYIGKNFHRLPLALHVQVGDSLGLAAFLTALRSFSDQAAPGMTRWENRSHLGRDYVRIGASPEFAAAEEDSDPLARLAIHYAALPGSFVLSLREEVIHRAIERQAARSKAEPASATAPEGTTPWLGESLALHADRGILGHPLLWQFGAQNYASWKNLAILNEWRRLRPATDPVLYHEVRWQLRLVCPGGGDYTWNEEWQTMESTVYGHPGQPRRGPRAPADLEGIVSGDFGLSFEGDGLRARVVIRRE